MAGAKNYKKQATPTCICVCVCVLVPQREVAIPMQSLRMPKTKQKGSAECSCVRSRQSNLRSLELSLRRCFDVCVVSVSGCDCDCKLFFVANDWDYENRDSETDWLPSQPGICICIASPLHSQVSRTRKRPCENIATTNLELFTQTVKESLTINNTSFGINNKIPSQKRNHRWKSPILSQNSIQDRSPRIRYLQNTLDYTIY